MPQHEGQWSTLQGSGKGVAVQTMKANGGVQVYLHSFFTSTLDGGERSTSHHGDITPEGTVPVKLMFKNTF